MNQTHQELLRDLPPVNELLEHPAVAVLVEESGRDTVIGWIRDGLIAGGMLREVELTQAMPRRKQWSKCA